MQYPYTMEDLSKDMVMMVAALELFPEDEGNEFTGFSVCNSDIVLVSSLGQTVTESVCFVSSH